MSLAHTARLARRATRHDMVDGVRLWTCLPYRLGVVCVLQPEGGPPLWSAALQRSVRQALPATVRRKLVDCATEAEVHAALASPPSRGHPRGQ